MPEAWRGATCGPWPSNRHSGWCACVCMGVCWCVWFKLNAPFNQFCWHALLALPAFLGDSLSLPLSLILFNIFSATSASLSLHAMIPSCPLSPSALVRAQLNLRIRICLIYLFIYCHACLLFCLWLPSSSPGQGMWPAFLTLHSHFAFALSVLWPKNWNWFYSICNATFHHALFMLLHFTGYAEERPPSQGSPFAAVRLLKSLWLLHRFMVLCLNDCLFWHTVATGRGSDGGGARKKYHIESKSDNQVINLNWNS